MTLRAAAIAPTFAVKNGPAGMWRALDPGGAGTVGAFLTSPPVLAITTCAWLALAAVLYRRSRRGRLPSGLVAATGALGLLLVAELATRISLLGLLVPLLLAGLWIAALWRRERRESRPHEHQTRVPDETAEVIDLARWREHREAHRKTGSH